MRQGEIVGSELGICTKPRYECRNKDRMYFDIQKGHFLGRASDPTSTPNRSVPLAISSSLKNMLRRTYKLLMINFCSRHYGAETGIYFAMQSIAVEFLFYVKKSQSPFPRQWCIGRRLSPFL